MPSVATTNPFALLSGVKEPREQKPRPKPIDAKPPKKKEVIEAKKVAKVVSLTETKKVEEEKKVAEKEVKKEEHKDAKVEKIEKALTDRHDRSAKGDRVRKEGKGQGGWDEANPVAAVEETAAAWDDDDKDKKQAEKQKPQVPELTEEEKLKQEAEQKQKELEEKQMTYEEYLEKQKKQKIGGDLHIRTIEATADQFKNMKKVQHETVSLILKKKTPANPAANSTPAPKQDDKKEKAQKIKIETGFRMEAPARGRGGRGEGGYGGRGRDGRGRGRGGRGRGQQNHAEEKAAPATPEISDETAFPALGGKAV